MPNRLDFDLLAELRGIVPLAIQHPVAEGTIEALNVGILCGLSRLDEFQLNVIVFSPLR